jgi:geranylgeranyl pyrophosphate synthase
MRHALIGKQGSAASETKISRWASLPGLCCLAAGGEREWADNLTLAWLLYYAAADLMDSVQDNDEADEWWQDTGPGAALAVASGLYFSGSLALDQLHQDEYSSQVASDIIQEFFRAFLIMTSGQHLDLTTGISTLDEYWRLAESKSGEFFQLACKTGARLATTDQVILSVMGKYGLHLGLLIQVMDDLEDIHLLRSVLPAGHKSKIRHSLPFIYALEMNPLHARERLTACLENAERDQQAVEELVALLDESETGLYVMAEMEHHRQSALAGLESANLLQPYKDALVALVGDL